jgi:hypothetical protein
LVILARSDAMGGAIREIRLDCFAMFARLSSSRPASATLRLSRPQSLQRPKPVCQLTRHAPERAATLYGLVQEADAAKRGPKARAVLKMSESQPCSSLRITSENDAHSPKTQKQPHSVDGFEEP